MKSEYLSSESRRIVNDHIRANLFNPAPAVYTFDLPEGKITVNAQVFLTPGVQALEKKDLVDLVQKIVDYKDEDFEPGNDTYGEHDFLVLHFKDIKYYAKFDYLDKSLNYLGNNDFVLTIMKASEW